MRKRLLAMSVFVEIKSQLAAAQISIRLPERKPLEVYYVEVKKSSIIVGNSESEYVYKFNQDYEFLPMSCHGLSWSKGEVHMRTQISQKQQKVQQCDTRNENLTRTLEQIQMGTNWFCSKCGQTVTPQKIRFNRVLPLPSEGWAEVSNNLFCCNHGQSSNDSNISNMAPRLGDCLVGEYYCVVHPEFMGHTKEKSLCCSRCRQVLGNVFRDKGSGGVIGLRFFLHTLTISEGTRIELENNSYNWELLFISLLCSSSHLQNNYRFLIETRQAGILESVLQLWVFDTNTEILSSVLEPGIHEVTSQPASRVLYKSFSQLTNSDLDTWKQDVAVNCLELPHTIVLKLLELLMSRTKCFPPSQRKANGFQVAYLRKYQSVSKS